MHQFLKRWTPLSLRTAYPK